MRLKIDFAYDHSITVHIQLRELLRCRGPTCGTECLLMPVTNKIHNHSKI